MKSLVAQVSPIFRAVCTHLSSEFGAMDSRVGDPELAAVVTESSDEEPPPPTALHGINLLVPGGQSVSGVVRSNFHLNHEVPGLLRFRNGRNEPLAPTTPVSDLRWPKRLFVQISSFSVWSAVDLEVARRSHAPWPTWTEQVETGTYSVRIYFHFLSTFRLLDVQQQQLEHLQALVDNLTERVRQLEVALLAGTPLTIPAQAVQIWSGPSPSVWEDQFTTAHEHEPEAEMGAAESADGL